MLDGMVTKQATIISYMDDFKLMMIMCVAAMPLVFLLRNAAKPPEIDHSALVECRAFEQVSVYKRMR